MGEKIRLSVAQALVRYLQVQYSERDGHRQRLIPGIAAIFGHGNVAGLGEALAEEGRDLTFIQGHNEQSMVHMASAFARERRRLQALAVTSSIGPGATNMVTGAALATVNRLPVLLLPGDVYGTRRQGPVLQQLEHPSAGDVSVNDCFRPVSRYFDRIIRPEQLPEALAEAMRVLTDPAETGAVTLALPQDVQSEAFSFPAELFAERTWPIERPVPDPAALERALELIAAAKRPLVIAGGGVRYSEAEDALEAFSARFSIPVAETFAGKGAMRLASERVLGGIGVEGGEAANQAARDADLVIALGTRLGDFITGSRSLFQDPDVRFLSINVTGKDSAKQGAVALRGDARVALEQLTDRLADRQRAQDPGWLPEVAERSASWRARLASALASGPGEALSQASAIAVVNAEARPGDAVVTAAGAPPGELLKVWDATGGRRCHIEFGYSCMGYELPGGLGTRLARADGDVVVIVGDGSYLLNPGELATMAELGARVTVVILDNHGYQVIRRLQLAKTGSGFGNEFRVHEGPPVLDGRGVAQVEEGPASVPDLARSAEGLGATAFSASDGPSLADALHKAREVDGPSVIVVPVEPQAWSPPGGAFWDVAPAEVSEDPLVVEARQRYEAERVQQRYYGPSWRPLRAEEVK
jgi:3D-(3,5/4)-trihydroxycyclohexane-1,2-dione acylhydrolase (decyclizing)